VLTAADQQRLTQLATDQIRVAERNLQTATGKRLNSLQGDLYQKVQGFLSQAHEAIRANDWVRAQNLAEKAQVLSSELVKSF
jgi:flagellin-specific chaperone FliS